MTNIKLIIWDLDDTFWRGTLDEGDINIIPEHIELVKRLNENGIINTICSKNDFSKAKKKLEECRVWDEFILPRIEWNSKGNIVKEIIQDFQLRNENVLFIDDNKLNLNEVLYFNPNIKLLNPMEENLVEKLNKLIESSKPDNRRRFEQYKVLERKNYEKKKFQSNAEFLRESQIVIRISHDCDKYIDRIEELINRTNQLNFTKNRLNRTEIVNLLNNYNLDNFVVFANDKFGDYGLIGFVCFDKSENKLLQFVFSCRTLNMGIEQFIWAELGFPNLKIIGDVSTTLIKGFKPDWIKIVGDNIEEEKYSTYNKILLIGGCDLFQLQHYLRSEASIDVFFNFPSKKYGVELHRDSINFIYASKYLKVEEQNKILENFPFADKSFFEVPNFGDYDIIMYSPLIDYVQNQYVFKENEQIKISWGDYTLSSIYNLDYEVSEMLKIGVDPEEINKFKNNWIPVGPITKMEFLNKLKKIFNDYHGKLILLTGAEKIYTLNDRKYLRHHHELNEAIDEIKNILKNKPIIIKIDDFIDSEQDFTDSIRHYQKYVYKRLAEYIVKEISIFHKKGIISQYISKVKTNLLKKIIKLKK
jgi:FkbH-like protein